jgi:hypothetical protein
MRTNALMRTIAPGLITVMMMVFCVHVLQISLYRAGAIGVVAGLISIWMLRRDARKKIGEHR